MRLTEDIKQLIVKCMHNDLSPVEKDALPPWLAESPAHRIYHQWGPFQESSLYLTSGFNLVH